MLRRFCAAIALTTSALLAAPAVAQEVDVTSTTTVGWHLDNDDDPDDTENYDDDYGEIQERLTVSGTYGDFFGSLRLDFSTYLSKPTAPGDPVQLHDRYETKVTPEKVFVRWSQRDVEVLAGDTYVSFGRGLALSMRKVDEFGTDSSFSKARR